MIPFVGAGWKRLEDRAARREGQRRRCIGDHKNELDLQQVIADLQHLPRLPGRRSQPPSAVDSAAIAAAKVRECDVRSSDHEACVLARDLLIPEHNVIIAIATDSNHRTNWKFAATPARASRWADRAPADLNTGEMLRHFRAHAYLSSREYGASTHVGGLTVHATTIPTYVTPGLGFLMTRDDENLFHLDHLGLGPWRQASTLCLLPRSRKPPSPLQVGLPRRVYRLRGCAGGHAGRRRPVGVVPERRRPCGRASWRLADEHHFDGLRMRTVARPGFRHPLRNPRPDEWPSEPPDSYRACLCAWHICCTRSRQQVQSRPGRDRGTARATLGKGLAVSAFLLYVPV